MSVTLGTAGTWLALCFAPRGGDRFQLFPATTLEVVEQGVVQPVDAALGVPARVSGAGESGRDYRH